MPTALLFVGYSKDQVNTRNKNQRKDQTKAAHQCVDRKLSFIWVYLGEAEILGA